MRCTCGFYEWDAANAVWAPRDVQHRKWTVSPERYCFRCGMHLSDPFEIRVFLVRVFLDGDMWCAVRSDFTNLQESAAGFGTTPADACDALETQAAKAAEEGD